MAKTIHNYRTSLGKYCHAFGLWLGSNTFFYVILGVFAAQALWIAWSGAYSMAYDEFFHLGIIQEYVKGFTPFINQPTGPAELGALARDPSFLYYYLMSFPYRIISAIWHTLMPQIIALRVLNVAMFMWGIILYRKLLVRAGLSRRVTHVILLFFILTPTVVMVAAQLNYDNMMFLASGAALLLATNVTLALRKDKTFSLLQLISLITVLMAGSIVKYAFLPIALAIGVFILAQSVIAFRKKQLTWHNTITEFHQCLQRPATWLLLLGTLFVGTLFMQRIGGNIIMYRTPAPDCGVVLSVEDCMANAPYGRNERYKQKNYPANVTAETKRNYPKFWYKKMLHESFFVVGPRQLNYVTGDPLPTAYTAGAIILPTIAITILVGFVWLWRSNPIMQLFAVTSAFYVGVLFHRNFTDYVRLGVPAAIHGRYVIYIMPLVAAMAAAVLIRFVHGWRRYVVYGVITVLLGMMILGGGWLPFVIRSADNWMWPHAVPASRTLRSTLWHVIPKQPPNLNNPLR